MSTCHNDDDDQHIDDDDNDDSNGENDGNDDVGDGDDLLVACLQPAGPIPTSFKTSRCHLSLFSRGDDH